MAELSSVLLQIDEINSLDPNQTKDEEKSYPKELIYGQRMTEMLHQYMESPSVELQIAARGQHIKRWEIARDEFPMDRKGYLKWRTQLKIFHGQLLSEIMKKEGFGDDSIDKVITLVTKKKLKTDLESQQLEDVICLVFLQYYFGEFLVKHDEEKVVDIVRKTWGKMTEVGHEMALKLSLTDEESRLIKKALT